MWLAAGGWPATWRRRRRRATRTCWRSLGQNIRCPCWCSSSRCRFGSAKSCPARVSCCTATTTLRSSIRCSVAWWTYGLFNLGHLQQWKFAQFHNKFAKVGSKFCQILNKCSIFCLLAKFRHIRSHWFRGETKVIFQQVVQWFHRRSTIYWPRFDA